MRQPEIPLVSTQEFIVLSQGIAEMFGQDMIDRVFRSTGFSEHLLHTPGLFLPNAEYMRFLEACAQQTRQPLFGAMIGESVPIADLGDFGAYVTATSSLSEALSRACRALQYHESGSRLTRICKGNHTVLAYRPPTPKAVGTRHQCDAVAAMLIDLVRTYTGADWRPEWIGLTAATGKRSEILAEHFGVEIRPSRIGTELPIPRDDLSAVRPITPNARPLTCRDLRHLISSMPPLNFSGVLGHILHPLLRDGFHKIDQIAEKISLNPRTIQRRLQAEGTTYSHVLKTARQAWAQDLLTGSDASISDIATQLGYASKQQFIRAFKSWNGTTPGAFRHALVMTERQMAIPAGRV